MKWEFTETSIQTYKTTYENKIQNSEFSRKKGLFEKGFTPNWTEEVFTFPKIQRNSPVTYKITDYNGEEIQGTFYEQELQKTSQEVFRIEKIVKKDCELRRWCFVN